jgi:hypothetical protein
MLIDCDSCTVRGAACLGCVVSALFDAPEQVARLTPVEDRAIEAFTRAGFEVEVLAAPTAAPAPLRMVPLRRGRHVA